MLVSSFMLAAIVSGCAAKAKAPDLVWPDPPDKPRIKYLGSLQSKDDVGGASFSEMLVGKDKSVALYQPMGLALSEDRQRLYVADRAWNLVFVFDFKSGALRTIGDQERYALSMPVGVALDAQENVYVSDTGTRTVRVYDKSGQFLRGIGKGTLDRPTGVTIDAARRLLYAVDTGANDSTEAHRIKVFDLEGKFLRTIGRRGDQDGEFNFPTFASVDAEGRLYVVDSVNNRIEVFDAEGNFLWKFGQSGDRIGDFARPKGVAVDGFGNIYVVDSRWSNIQIFNPQGRLLMIFAGVGTYPGLLMNPTAIAIDRENKIYVSDTLGRRVSVYQLIDTSADDNIETQTGTKNLPEKTGG
ncbi:MAG: SMP-30/gluconolactonase/LRE family protein [Deltaproteobacteria bacterium]|nr:SMP-30/gluconolactonase/LRE family protein [Deltaproteobacteria bacterium]